MIGKNIARYGASLTLSLCLLSGCASKTQWTKPRFNSDEFKQDSYLCDREANILASQQAGAMSSAVNPLFMYAVTKGTFFNNCMKARGYQQFKTDKERELIESSEKPLSPTIGDQGERWGADWKFYIVGPGDGQWYYDSQSIRQVSEDTVRVWIKLATSEERLKQEAKFKIRSITDTFGLYEFNCNTKKVRLLSCTMYDKNGSVFFSTSNPGPWGPLHEIDDILFNIVCRSIYERDRVLKWEER